jgi:hypothetical protein
MMATTLTNVQLSNISHLREGWYDDPTCDEKSGQLCFDKAFLIRVQQFLDMIPMDFPSPIITPIIDGSIFLVFTESFAEGREKETILIQILPTGKVMIVVGSATLQKPSTDGVILDLDQPYQIIDDITKRLGATFYYCKECCNLRVIPDCSDSCIGCSSK